METGKFRVWLILSDGSYHLDTDWCQVEDVSRALSRLINGPSALINKEVKVVDSLDCTVFHWKEGEILWPKS